MLRSIDVHFTWLPVTPVRVDFPAAFLNLVCLKKVIVHCDGFDIASVIDHIIYIRIMNGRNCIT